MACGFTGSPWSMPFFKRGLVHREQRNPYRSNFPVIIYSKRPLVKYCYPVAAFIGGSNDPYWPLYPFLVFDPTTNPYWSYYIRERKTGLFCRRIRPSVFDHDICAVDLLFY